MQAIEIIKLDMDQDKTPTVEVGEEGFEANVLRSPQPVLVAFWAAWNRACDILDWELEAVAAECAGEARIVRVNADECPDLCAWYRIESIPTLLFFADGNLYRKIVGTTSRQVILEVLLSHCTRKDTKSSCSSNEEGSEPHRAPGTQTAPIPRASFSLKDSL